MKILLVCSVLLLSAEAEDRSESPFSFLLKDAPPLRLPGVPADGSDALAPGSIDCNSPAHWDGDTMYMFFSIFHPYRSSGADVAQLSRAAQRVKFDNEEGWKMGGRWMEATRKEKDGTLFMWYHNEPFVLPSKTAPRIGCMVSNDNGLTWRDLGIVLEAPAGSNNLETANHYFVGGNGDFSVVPDRSEKHLYFFFSTYNKDINEQGVSVATMACKDRDKPSGKVHKWFRGRWEEPGLGGHVTPIFPAAGDWHGTDVDVFWGPSVHYNTHLKAWVMLLNRARDKEWAQEGVYISFNQDLSKPGDWTKPVKILDAAQLDNSKWYPQVIGSDASKHETDKLAGKRARLFVAGTSKWEMVFVKQSEKLAVGE